MVSAASVSVAGRIGGAALVFALRLGRSEWGSGAEAEAFANQRFGLLRRASLGHGDVTSLEVAGVQFPQSCRRQLGSGHGDKGVATRLVRGRIEFQLDLGDGAYPGEEEPQVGFGDAGGKVSDI